MKSRQTLYLMRPAESAGDNRFDDSKDNGANHGDKHQVNKYAEPFLVLHNYSFTGSKHD